MRAELQAGDGDHRHQRVLQRVAEMDRAVGQAARARELDVVGAQHLEHLGAHQPHDQRQLEQRQRDRRQDQCLQPSASAGRWSSSRAPPSRRGRRTAASRACTAKTRISRMPIRKVGSDTPSSETVSSTCDQEAAAAAAPCRRPAGCRPTSASSAAANASSSVAGQPLDDQRRDLAPLAQRQAEIALHRVADEARELHRRTAGRARGRRAAARAARASRPGRA